MRNRKPWSHDHGYYLSALWALFAARTAAVQVVSKCVARKTGFYEVCGQTFTRAPPGYDFSINWKKVGGGR